MNPKKLLAKFDQQRNSDTTVSETRTSEETDKEAFLDKRECFICYDSDKQDTMIQPCDCTGDVSSVHHECLRR